MSEANRVHPSVKVSPTFIAIDESQIWVGTALMNLKLDLGRNLWTGGVEGFCGNCGSRNPPPYQFSKYEVPDDSGIGGGA